MKNPARIRTLSRSVALIGLLAAMGMHTARGGEVDIADQPLATRPEVQAKPNLMFILDNSGSMNWSYMPDELGKSDTATDEPHDHLIGYYTAQCNGVAYDPEMDYEPPTKADGTPYPNATFSAAKSDGYSSSSSTVNLGDRFYYTYSGSQPSMDWRYTTGGVIHNTFYNECFTPVADGSSLFTKVIVKATSGEAQKYANWYSYYRKRYLLMRTTMGRAMVDLSENYRIGFSTINDTGVTEGSNHFRDIKDFDATQKGHFYASLYGSTPSGSTPLRTALAKAGRYFAKKVYGQTYDPMQYSCQRNYALLSTDGYWNGGGGVQLDGSSIGQQDGTEVRPMRDDAGSIKTETITYTANATQNLLSNTQTRTRTWSRTERRGVTTGCNNGRWKVVSTTQRYVQTATQQFVTPRATTATYTRTTTWTDGVITSGPTDSAITYGNWSNTGAASTVTTNTGDPTAGTTYTSVPNSTTESSCGTGHSTAAGQTTYTSPTAGTWGSWSSENPYTTTPPSVGTWASSTQTVESSDAGTPSTLADVAEYYYITDLRDSAYSNCTSSTSGSTRDVCENIVPAIDGDASKTQHMNTFTIGLGLKGTLPNDAATLKALTEGSVLWPSPSTSGNATNIDDLWHTALNGRGSYYSAQSATQLRQAISDVVQTVAESLGASSAASTSSLELVAGDNNFVYRASYTTKSWFGDLEAFALNGKTAVIATTPTWSAKARIDAMDLAQRKIYFKNGTSRSEFTYANLDATQKTYFSNFCSQASIPAQCAAMNADEKAYANDGARLVDYLRGNRKHESPSTEGTAAVPALYRARSHLLGDIINGAPVYVGKPPFSYADTGYADFVTANANRKPVVYVAANDGMLHAISGQGAKTASGEALDGGSELWAYVPGAVMRNMYRLADTNYGNNHQYFVDGAPVMGDIKVGGTWKTILVGGLNKGGKSYYALDITDPVNPIPLWEFTTSNMGLSYGNPIIAKRADGTWIVALTSGYNNGAGDGRGHLYILNAYTGAQLMDIATSAGDATTPSGLAKINAWVEDPSDNTSKRFYGGDQLGNVWRFDIDSLVLPHQSAMLLAQLKLSATTPQPITTKPVTAELSGKPVVIVATGRYLGDTDISDSTQQAIYAIKDPMTATGWGDVRNNANFVQQTLTLNAAEADATKASVSANKVNWEEKAGWRIDFPHSRERVFSNMGLQLGTLAVGTAIPSGDACASGGSSWRYYLNIETGGAVLDNPVGILWSKLALIVGVSWVKDTDGNVRIIYQNSDSTISSEVPPTGGDKGSGNIHRTSWRELAD